jgi:uncharacterized protein (TIGR02246 family)
MRAATIAIGLALAGACPVLRAQEAPAAARPEAARRTADEQAIAALVEAFAKAFNAGDANAAAATYAEDALVVDEDGVRIEGREAIRAQLAGAFAASPGTTIAIKPEFLRFLGPDTALERGRTTITPAGPGAAPESTQFTVVYTRRDGRWLQSAVRDEQADDLTPHDRLKELEWMLGEWVNESQDAVVHTTCKWTEDGNFLVRDFVMKAQGSPVLSGTQRIGWDPVRRQFKTWVFDSEGGFGEGYWTRDGDQWTLRVEGVRQDGKHVSATNIITRLGKDRASWQSVGRSLGGAALPGIDEFTLVRKPPEPGK